MHEAVRPSGINERTLHVRRVRLIMKRVTVRRNTVLVCNWPLRPTHTPILCGMGNEYQSTRLDSGTALTVAEDAFILLDSSVE